jgi:hypothetical protein
MNENNEAVETVEVIEEAEAPKDGNVQISVEQICAAIISSLGSVEITVENLLTNYQDKSISVNQNEETKSLTFTLVNNADIATPTETE